MVLRGFRVIGELHDDEPVLVVAAIEKNGLLRGTVAPVRGRVVQGRVTRTRRLSPNRETRPVRVGCGLFGGEQRECECEAKARGASG